MKHDLLACQMDSAGNGSLALIKAACLAGFAHDNLRMDCTAVMWVTIFSNSEGKATAVHGEYYNSMYATACDKHVDCIHKPSAAHSSGFIFRPVHSYRLFTPASDCKGECDDVLCVCTHVSVHVIECAELLTSSRGGALMSSVPWNWPTPHVQGDWHCPVPWHTSASDGLTGPWRRTSCSTLCLSVCALNVKNLLLIVYQKRGLFQLLFSWWLLRNIYQDGDSPSMPHANESLHTFFCLMILRKCSPLVSLLSLSPMLLSIHLMHPFS